MIHRAEASSRSRTPARGVARRLICGLLLIASVASAQPSKQEVADIVHRLLGKDVEVEACEVKKRGDDYAIDCRRTECRSCNVTYVYTTLSRKDGKWRIASTRRERRGDTGECGCCQLAF